MRDMQREKETNCKSDYIIKQNLKYYKKISTVPGYELCWGSDTDTAPGHWACYVERINMGLLPPDELFSLRDNDGDLVACKNILALKHSYKDKWQQYCTATKAVYTNNLALCDQAGVAKISCYESLVLRDSSISLQFCDALEEEDASSRCYSMVAARTNDKSICDLAKKNYPKQIDQCTGKVNEYKRWLKKIS